MATPPQELRTCADQVARLLGRDDATPASLKQLVAPYHSIKSLWGRLVRGRPAVLLQRAVTLAQLALLRQSNGVRLRPSQLIWVDDRPAGNSKEASELRSLGLDVKQVTSTAEALAVANEGAHVKQRLTPCPPSKPSLHYKLPSFAFGGSYFVTDSFRPEDGLDHAAEQLIRSIRAVPSLAASPVLIYVGAEPLDLISLISSQPPVLISNNPSVLDEFARCLLPRPALPLAPLGSAPNANPNPSTSSLPAAAAPAAASPAPSAATASKVPPPLISVGSNISTSSSSSFIDHRPDEPMLEKQMSLIPDRKRSRDAAELSEAQLPLVKQSSVPPLPASLSLPSLSPSLSLSPFLLKENHQQILPQVVLQWQLHSDLRAGDKTVVSVALPVNAPPVELWLTGVSSCPAFAVPHQSASFNTIPTFFLLPVAAGPAMLELRTQDHAVYSSHSVIVLPYQATEPPAPAAPKLVAQASVKQQSNSTPLPVQPAASAPPAAAAKSLPTKTSTLLLHSEPLRSSDPLSLLNAVDDMPNATRRRLAPVDTPSTPPLPTAVKSPVSKTHLKPVEEEEEVEEEKKDDDTGGTEEIPDVGGTLPLPSDDGGSSPTKSSPRGDEHGGASAGVTATVPLPD